LYERHAVAWPTASRWWPPASSPTTRTLAAGRARRSSADGHDLAALGRAEGEGLAGRRAPDQAAIGADPQPAVLAGEQRGDRIGDRRRRPAALLRREVQPARVAEPQPVVSADGGGHRRRRRARHLGIGGREAELHRQRARRQRLEGLGLAVVVADAAGADHPQPIAPRVGGEGDQRAVGQAAAGRQLEHRAVGAPPLERGALVDEDVGAERHHRAHRRGLGERPQPDLGAGRRRRAHRRRIAAGRDRREDEACAAEAVPGHGCRR
jgi:hypothetical protein